MIWTVTWLPDAHDELLNLYLQAVDRRALSNAANQIDRELRVDADTKGLPFVGGDRILRIAPLVVVFSLYPDDCLVEVNQVFRVP